MVPICGNRLLKLCVLLFVQPNGNQSVIYISHGPDKYIMLEHFIFSCSHPGVTESQGQIRIRLRFGLGLHSGDLADPTL